MGHKVEVVSIIRDGRALYTADTVRAFPDGHLEGSIFEVQLSTRSGNPYFAYYLCPTYYFAAVGPAGATAFGGPHKTEEFRSMVSQHIARFVVDYLLHAHQISARKEIISFSHNKAHTNVLTYVTTLEDWYPIQHNDSEDEDAAERKADQVNRGRSRITDVIAVTERSPHS